MSASPSGTDKGAPDLNDAWSDELGTEEYRDPIAEKDETDG
jgi:hypothetical protein